MISIRHCSIWILLLATSLVACKEKTSDVFEVNGTLTNSSAKTIYLEEVPVATMQRVVVDSAILGSDGKFRLEATPNEHSVFNLRLDESVYPMASVINDAKSITLNATFSGSQNQFADSYEVKGSKASLELRDFMKAFNNDLQKIYLVSKRGDSLQKMNAPDSLIIPLVAEHNVISGNLKRMFFDAIARSENPALTMFELGYYQTTANNPAFGLQGLDNTEVSKIVSGLASRFPEHQGVASIKRELDSQEQTSVQASTAWMGRSAPEIILPDINGNEVKLSSYKGKYVLVDFWASWCKPCRYENPNVVNAYNKYKDKNFDILGVSLDEKKDAWLKAITDDKLTWTHVSDLKGWESAVVPVFNFGQAGIPYNLLLDPSGKVIGERLRGAELEARLAEVLK